MNELNDLLELIGILEEPAISNNGLVSNKRNYYLLHGERILTLARQKKKVSKKANLTVRLCDLNYPKLDYDLSIALKQLSDSIIKYTKKEFSKKAAKGFSELTEIPFFYTLSSLMPMELLKSEQKSDFCNLVKNVTQCKFVLYLSIGSNNFYIPFYAEKAFKNGLYYLVENPSVTAHIIHAESVLCDLFLIHWLNTLILNSEEDHEVNNILKNSFGEVIAEITSYVWNSDGVTTTEEKVLLSNEFTYTNGFYTLNNSNTVGIIRNVSEFKTYFHVINCICEKEKVMPESFIIKEKDRSFFYINSLLKKCILKSLYYYVSTLQDMQLQKRQRKKIAGTVARAYTTKKNIPNTILHKMKSSIFNNYFGFVEFDQDIDATLTETVSNEFVRINEEIFSGYKNKEVTLRIRKLGRHKAYGLYYPSLKTLIIDLRHPDSFFHEFFHMLDDQFEDLSSELAFFNVYEKYKSSVLEIVKYESEVGNSLFSKTSKYNLDYYLQRCEVFARCGEIHLYRNMNIESSLLKHESTHSFAYPDNEELNHLINKYYSNLLQSIPYFIKGGDYENTLCNANKETLSSRS